VGEHDQGARQTIEALFQEHISREVYEAWYREAVDELLAQTTEEGEAGVPLAEVQRLVKRRTLLHLAERTSGALSHSFRNVASEFKFRRRGDEG
jgi:hypothetical protein